MWVLWTDFGIFASITATLDETQPLIRRDSAYDESQACTQLVARRRSIAFHTALALAHVDDRGVHPRAFFLRQSCRLIEILGPSKRIRAALQVGTDVQRDDARALGSEIDRVGTALAACGTRYHRDLVVQLSH